jgi:hypothetical protein
MYADNEQSFEESYIQLKDYLAGFPVFLAYIDDRWACDSKKLLWAKPWRRDAEFNTNNLIESYHNKLKTFYLGRSRNHRVDRIVYMLSKIVTLDYRRDETQVLFGIKPAYLSGFEQERKRIADRLPLHIADLMVQETDDEKVLYRKEL